MGFLAAIGFFAMLGVDDDMFDMPEDDEDDDGAAADGAGGVAGLAAAGGDDGVIGALEFDGGFCAQTGAAIARAAAMATPDKRCFMLVVLCGSSNSTLRQR